jgi:hypothetical protein
LEADLEFLMRAALKIETIREDLGKVGPVIASQVEEAMLGRRTRLDTTRAEQEAEPVRRMLKFERKVREQLEKLAAIRTLASFERPRNARPGTDHADRQDRTTGAAGSAGAVRRTTTESAGLRCCQIDDCARKARRNGCECAAPMAFNHGPLNRWQHPCGRNAFSRSSIKPISGARPRA